MAYVSPGVFWKLIDLSAYVRNVPSTIGFIAIVSEKGRDNELIFTNARDFYMEFGEPNINYGGSEYGQGMYVADSFLKNSDSLYVIRVMADTATYANMLFVGENSGEYGVDATSSLFLTAANGLNNGEEVDTVVAADDLAALELASPAYLTEYTDAAYASALMIRGRGRGEWYNYFKISITPHANTVRAAEGIYVLDIYKRQEVQDYDTDLGQWVDSYAIASTFEVSFNPEKVEYGTSMFIEDIVNTYFDDLVVVADRDMCREIELAGCDWSIPFLDGAVQLAAGGGDADTITNATELLGEAYSGSLPRVNNDYQGYGNTEVVDEVIDTENYYFTIVLDGGYPADVKQYIYELCRDQRQDCVALMDLGDNKSPAEALTARQFTYTYNTYHCALYECYSKIYDKYTGRDLWLTPIYHMANVVPYTDRVAELWWAPAGFNRATLPNIKRLRYSPRQGDRDLLYLEQINPIVKFNAGYTVWGQLTSQKRPTAMQDLNITRLILYIKRALEQYCKFYIFELNDEDTWQEISGNIDQFLKMIQNKRGLYKYSVDVGASSYEIKSKQMHVNVTLDPTRVIEQIHLNFYVV